MREGDSEKKKRIPGYHAFIISRCQLKQVDGVILELSQRQGARLTADVQVVDHDGAVWVAGKQHRDIHYVTQYLASISSNFFFLTNQ